MNAPASSMAPERDQFGRLAISLGYLTEEQLNEALVAQRASCKTGLPKKLGTMLVDLGYLNEVQRQIILSQQNLTPVAVQIAGFEIMGKLGAGGMGMVYKARQVSLDRIVALKVLRSELAQDVSIRDRFLAEARAVAKLNHPNIVTGISVGCEGGRYYFAMEYIEGESLAEKILAQRNGLPEADAVEYVRQVALALQHAHNRRLLHRDIKPENILLTNEGQTKLTDLGLARALNRKPNARITQHGATVGTPHYVSPEQAQGSDKLTRATDLYSLGATLYHLLTGRVPYEARNCNAVMLRHISDKIPDPRRIRPRLSAAVSSICMKLMQKDPRDRYASAVRLAEDLERVQRGESIRHAEMVAHPTRRLEPLSDRRLRPARGGRNGQPRTMRASESTDKTGGNGFDNIVTKIAKRLGL